MKRVVFCDIDGTLLNLKRTFVRSLFKQIFNDFGLEIPDLSKITFAGKTDYSIFRSMLPGNEHYFDDIKNEYVSAMEKELMPDHITLTPHVENVLSYLQNQGYAIGLLTGNFEAVAATKLKAASINDFFHFGAYGGTVNNRNELAVVAHETAENYLGVAIKPENMIIIGDTPADVACAKNYGSKSVAVTTGSYSARELKKHRPYKLLHSLKNPDSWLPGLFNI